MLETMTSNIGALPWSGSPVVSPGVEKPLLCSRFQSGSCAFRRGRRLFLRRFQLALLDGAGDFGQEQLAHLVAGCLVEPVEEPAAGGGLSEAAVDLEAHPREEL